MSKKIKQKAYSDFWYDVNCKCENNKFTIFKRAIEHFDNCKESTLVYFNSAYGERSIAYPFKKNEG